MKKIYILFLAGMMAMAAVSCKKDDNTSTNNNTNPTTKPPLDVWAAVIGTYKGNVTNGQGTTPNQTVSVTKLSDSKVRLTPGAGNTLMQTVDINVFKGDSSIYHQQGTFDGVFFIIGNSKPPQMIYTQNSGNVSFDGLKQ